MTRWPASAPAVTHAVTLSGPWPDAILRPVPPGARAPGPKDVENRSRRPPAARLGSWVAVHSSRKVDRAGLEWLRNTFGYPWGAADLSPPGLILGVVRLLDAPPLVAESPGDPWYFGPRRGGKPNVGWRLGEALAVAPLPWRKGFLGCWPLPGDVRDALDAALRGLAAGA